MLNKSTITMLCAFTTLVIGQNSNAALISESNYVTDTDTQIDWLHLSETQGLSYAQVREQMTSDDGEFAGWVFASEDQIRTFLDNAGGSGNYDTPTLLPDGTLSRNNVGNMDAIYSSWGVFSDQFDHAGFWWGESTPHPTAAGGGVVWGASMIGDQEPNIFFSDTGHINLRGSYLSSNYGPIVIQPISVENYFPSWGSALVRPSVVPVPAAVWLFTSGLIVLLGASRRKRN